MMNKKKQERERERYCNWIIYVEGEEGEESRVARWGDGEGDNKEQFIQGDLYKKKKRNHLDMWLKLFLILDIYKNKRLV